MTRSRGAAVGETSTAARYDVTELLLKWREGEEAALDRLVPIVHRELRRIARTIS
jgi:hypothetical protein